MIKTRKIEIVGGSELWNQMRFLQFNTYKTANDIMTSLFFNDEFENRIIDKITTNETELSEHDTELKSLNSAYEESKKKSDLNKVESCKKRIQKLKGKFRKESQEILYKNGLYNTSKQNTGYQLASEKYPEISSFVRSAVSQKVFQDYKNDKKELWKGECSIRSYKKTMPIFFTKQTMNSLTANGFTFLGNEVFFAYGRDKSNNRVIVERIVKGEYDLGDSSIKIEERKGEKTKMFIFLVIKMPDSKTLLDKNIVVGADLGINTPVYVALNNGLKTKAIGSRKEFLKTRLAISYKRKDTQRNLVLAKGGHGRTRKMQRLEKLKAKERNFVQTTNHKYSKAVVDFALQNNAGTIHLENLKGIGEERKRAFLLRNWSYHELQTMIEYKAKANNIEVMYINPAYTSQMCSKCGLKGIRDKEVFSCNTECKGFEKKTARGGVKTLRTQNADANGAINIANSKKIIVK